MALQRILISSCVQIGSGGSAEERVHLKHTRAQLVARVPRVLSHARRPCGLDAEAHSSETDRSRSDGGREESQTRVVLCDDWDCEPRGDAVRQCSL